MKDFLGMVRDTLPIDNPIGTWQYGRNMVSNKKQKTVANEDGFSFEYLVNGTVIGSIVTNSDIVYFSKNEDGTDEIGVVNTENSAPTYITKIKSSLFNFQYNCPIEGVFIYNFKKELIVAWGDGIYSNSNKPYVLNLDDIPVELNPDKTLINNNEFTKLLMFPNIKEANISIEIEESNILLNDVQGVYITYAYAYNDFDVLPFFSISNFTELHDTYTKYYTPKITLTNLDTNFNKLQLGLVFKLKDSTLVGYKSFLFDYNSTFTYVINSLENFTITPPSDIIITNLIFDKIDTITKQNKELFVGNVVLKEKFNFQQYANRLNLIPILEAATDTDGLKITNKSTLMLDEVYSFYIELQFLDGSYSDAFHIPGRAPLPTETDIVTATDITNAGLPIILQNYKRFQIFDTSLHGVRFGYWENENETYPNTEDFNSTSIGGEDLRNTPIRYHRVPSKDNLPYSNYTNYGSSDINVDRYVINTKVSNFHTIVPQNIKDQIQGYRISYVKRTLNNSLIFTNSLMTNRYSTINGNASQGKIEVPTVTDRGQLHTTIRDINKMALFSSEMYIAKPNVNPTYLKINFLYQQATSATGAGLVVINPSKKYRTCTSITYLPSNNFVEGTAFREEMAIVTMDTIQSNEIVVSGANMTNGVLDVTLFSGKKSIYQGFKSNNLVILGKTNDLNNEVTFKGGDVFLQLFSINIHELANDPSNNNFYLESLIIRGLIYTPYNNVKFVIENTPPSTRYPTLLPFFGEVDSNHDFFGTTSDLKITGATTTILNDLTTIITNNFISDNINTFPFRIFRSLKISDENLSIKSFRSFLSNNYYEMPNDKGEIIALRGTDKKLYIQMKYALFIATIKDTLNTGTDKTFLGQSDLFEYIPKEILVDEKGYIGSNSKFACVFIKDMYITINSFTGQIFIISESIDEISKQGNMHWFRNNWIINKNIDNPFVSYGFLVGYDKEYNRLLFIKKDFEYIANENFSTFDGEFYIGNYNNKKLEFTELPQLVANSPIAIPEEKQCFKNHSVTLSYSLDSKTWQFNHDYFPNIIFNTHANLYSIINKLNGNNKASVYKHNNKSSKGLFYGEKFESYIDIIFNQNLDITKLYQSVHWVTTVINQNKGVEQFKTINKIALYNDNQCSGIITLNTSQAFPQKTRNNEWFFNDFRDLVNNSNSPILDEKGEILQENINNFKIWFEKSNFISKFIVVRFIIDNLDNDDVYIHQVNIKSIISK